jgi:hypothetical protein
VYGHLYNPPNNPDRWKSTCPPHPFLFLKHEIKGARSNDALPVDVGADMELLPDSDAQALVSYLLSLKKDQAVPVALDFGSKNKDGDL